MRRFAAGVFQVDVSDPSPMWITLRASDIPESPEIRFNPAHLADLKHVVERAIAHVENRDPGGTK